MTVDNDETMQDNDDVSSPSKAVPDLTKVAVNGKFAVANMALKVVDMDTALQSLAVHDTGLSVALVRFEERFGKLIKQGQAFQGTEAEKAAMVAWIRHSAELQAEVDNTVKDAKKECDRIRANAECKNLEEQNIECRRLMRAVVGEEWEDGQLSFAVAIEAMVSPNSDSS